MERKNLKEKALFLLCLGALAGSMSTEIYAQNDEPLYVENIEGGKGEIVHNDKDLVINAMEKEYALFSKASASMGTPTASIKINENNSKNTIQIIGDIKTSAEIIIGANDSKAEVEVNLNGEKSFFAGKMISAPINSSNKRGKEKITLNLKNSATWYVHNSNGKDSYNINGGTDDSLDGNLQTFITSDGGVIDIYHAIPKKDRIEYFTEPLNEKLSYLENGLDKVSKLDKLTKEVVEEIEKKLPEENLNELRGILGNLPEATEEKALEKIKEYLTNFVNKEIDIKKEEIIDIQAKGKIGKRTFILNGVEDRLQNTTFCISSDVEKGTADKIVLNDVTVNKDSETYSIQIVADPFKGKEWKVDENNKIYVMDIENIGTGKINVEGKEYTKETDAGLVEQIITPTIKEDGEGSGDWYLASIDKVENKGSGHIFAELGAGANAGMVAAWRADNGDLYQRMGNLRNNEAQQGVWGRIYTGENEVHKGIGLDLKYRAVQVGYDRKNSISDGKLFTGVAFGYFDGNVDYDHGSGESNSATVGAYATYLGRNGAYSDFIVKFGNIDNKLSYSSDNGNYYKADFDTYGLSADAEYGYRYDFNNNYYIEPLAQLSYIYIADKDYTMKLNGESGAKVSNDDYQSLIGYTGFHYGKKFDDSVVYLRAVLAHEFAGDIDVNARYENTKVNSSISGEDTWVEYGVGFDVKVKEDTAIYGRVQRTTGDVVKNKWHASVGIRYTF